MSEAWGYLCAEDVAKLRDPTIVDKSKCHVCGKTNENGGVDLKWCSRCHRVRYCSTSCQASDWKEGGHQYLCSSKVEVRESGNGNGDRGLFALCDFAVGDEIHLEKPLYKMDEEEPFKASAWKERLIYTLKDAIMYDGVKTPEGIGGTNGLPIHGTKQRLFLLTARANHACNGAQNAWYFWRADLGKMMLRAVYPIKKGDEITVCYLARYLPKQARQKELRENFGFDCKCSECTHATTERDRKLQVLGETIEDARRISQIDQARALNIGEMVLHALKIEGLDTPPALAEVHGDCFQYAARQSYVSGHTNVEKLKYHIKQAHQYSALAEGEDSEMTHKLGISMKEPNNPWTPYRGEALFP